MRALMLLVLCVCVQLAAADRAHLLAKGAKTVTTHNCVDVTNAQDCHATYAEGCTQSTAPNTYDPYLAFLKNVTPSPNSVKQTSAVLDSLAAFQKFDQVTIQLGLGKRNGLR